MTLAVNLGWSDLPLGAALEARLGRPCVVENDVRAAALGLHRRRVVGAIDDLAYLAVGTGVSAGVILDGRLHRGARGLAGEIGHVVVEPDGARCACGAARLPRDVRLPARASRRLSRGEAVDGADRNDALAAERRADRARRLSRRRRRRPARHARSSKASAVASRGPSTCWS